MFFGLTSVEDNHISADFREFIYLPYQCKRTGGDQKVTACVITLPISDALGIASYTSAFWVFPFWGAP